jgi:hypothetical protein
MSSERDSNKVRGPGDGATEAADVWSIVKPLLAD